MSTLKVRTRIYEALILIDPDLSDSQVKDLIADIEKNITTQGGEILKSLSWGRRRLAYPVHNKRFGNYHVLHFKGTGALNTDLSYRMQINEAVFKYLIINIDEKDWDKVPALPELTPEGEPKGGDSERGERRRSRRSFDGEGGEEGAPRRGRRGDDDFGGDDGDEGDDE